MKGISQAQEALHQALQAAQALGLGTIFTKKEVRVRKRRNRREARKRKKKSE